MITDDKRRLVAVRVTAHHPAYELGLDHAWHWFKMHSAQRYLFVNFWAVFVGVLTTALVSAVSREAWGVAIIVSASGVVITGCFQRLDRRTRTLIQAGEAALRPFQADLADQTGVPELDLLRVVHGLGRRGSYRRIIATAHLLAAALFLAAGLYALFQALP